MQKIDVVNIKCGGCAASISDAMQKQGFTNVSVDLEKQSVTFDGDRENGAKILSKLGYPEVNSEEAKSLFKKIRSLGSCAIGKMKQ